MKTYYDKNKRRYCIDENNPLGVGTEGSVFDISGMPNKVAKITNLSQSDPKLKTLATKIALMTDAFQSFDEEKKRMFTSQVTWPEISLYDASGRFCGFTMQKVTGHKTMMNAYASTQNLMTRFSFIQRVLIARNLCVPVNLLHKNGIVVGDWNPKNIMLDKVHGTIYLCDADSFHLRIVKNVRGRTVNQYLPATVWRPEYGPWELHDYLLKQKADLATTAQPSFNIESDLFGLAVHIFQILMKGTHPFAVQPCHMQGDSFSSVDIGWTDNIRRGLFVFSRNVDPHINGHAVKVPQWAPPYEVISPKLQSMFERAFVETKQTAAAHKRVPGDNNYMNTPTIRPTAAEWYLALDEFYHNITVCRKDPTHMYGNHLKYCPWCRQQR